MSILEHTIAMQPELAKLLDAVWAGPLLLAADLPAVPAALRKPPRASHQGGLFGGEGEDADANDSDG
ncbi:MAG: hypothetical protein ACT4PL_09380 [Phycisphaerales bacterium]